MAVLSEIRYPSTRIAKILSLVLALLVFAFVSVATISGFLLYQILHPARTPANIDLNVMMGHPTTISFPVEGGVSRDGWFFPGQRGAPTVVVCHGYQSQRADVLTLVTTLQDHQFNVFLFDFTGHGTSPGVTTLGYQEVGELRSAIQTLSTRDDIDKQHFGLWGVDMGGYVALEEAESDPRISALVVDDAYIAPTDLLRIELGKSGLTAIPYVLQLSQFEFRMVDRDYRQEPPVTARLSKTKGIPKLFVESDDQPELAAETAKLFTFAPDPKLQTKQRMSYREMSDEDRKSYESQIVNFFLQFIPPVAR